MTDVILAINAGSSSIKFALFTAERGATPLTRVYSGAIDGISGQPRFSVADAQGQQLLSREIALGEPFSYETAIGLLLDWIDHHEDGMRLIGVGHRVVHGGGRFSAPVLVDAAVMAELATFTPLAPLHQPHNLAPIQSLATHHPQIPQVACFDTVFHHTQPHVAQAFALPHDLSDQGIRRYGFHGLSYEYIASVLPEVVGPLADGRVVVAHLGNGASMCAMRGRKSVATTMGFSVLDGLMMGTRCGALDPGVILYLMGEHGMDVAAITDLLYHRSGLLGVSGVSNDMRALLDSSAPRAAEAIDLFVYRIGRALGELAATLGGLDALVFTAGIGEHAAPIRARVCREAAWLGLRLNPTANERGGPQISADDSTVATWVIPTDEDLMIARHTRSLLASA
ncbi:acetate/propionate family kinase [Oscillochloris sp. ZM17-4]|uniref:acetate/propionate family kinase n=1 Tax=Oscillochloris sp. ZM17-4 TaxID=2866714 RepID=UPI001C73C012|nr:acetate/propionate family kinase [Oscillochloris sp. ZM17-4]MBX0328423.1 acetate/propionate family kinase [Oscillochloris sp. ZM17-4]